MALRLRNPRVRLHKYPFISITYHNLTLHIIMSAVNSVVLRSPILYVLVMQERVDYGTITFTIRMPFSQRIFHIAERYSGIIPFSFEPNCNG